ncbi:sigma-54 dependent transcriptional regulator [uncultured Piscinibacter sp.]|uniref:sigma-54-dependent transcriptional regulator n=1 Tax=uncultured Piscinibacter sp. TaxID=1131835 RepID=UPI0026329304|nr:sigma-54 dependent transcriptional regulator [uncultured Piscinibacter sp.]
MNGAILIIEDEAVLAKNMRTWLERNEYVVESVSTAEEGLARMESFAPDAVVLDFNLPGMDGLQALERIRAVNPATQVIMVTGHGNVEMAVEAMKAGALDFLTKPVALSRLGMLLERATTQARKDSALAYYRRRDGEGADLSTLRGDSPGMRNLHSMLRQLLRSEAQLRDGEAPAVLVRGETGTGKELVARALHFNGPRRDMPFVELNCAALPAQLLESELFGHERGAFTDARERKLGLVETAEGGTLFLDEIGDMEQPLQAKLLKLLEERTVRRLGSVREQRVDVRIVAATHRPLDQLVREGRFRADLYFRLRVVQLDLPPLRERGDDILLLARHFVAHHSARYGRPVPTFSAAAERALMSHAWPGNVRELRNLLEQAVLLAHGDTLEAEDLGLRIDAAAVATDTSPGALGSRTLPEMEREALVQALFRAGWNVSRAARELGISRDTLRYRIDKHGLAAAMPVDFRETR